MNMYFMLILSVINFPFIYNIGILFICKSKLNIMQISE